MSVIWRRKCPEDTVSLILVSFLLDLDRILDQFGWIFMIFAHVNMILMIISFGQIQFFVLSLNVLL